jgi:hypothetical protein
MDLMLLWPLVQLVQRGCFLVQREWLQVWEVPRPERPVQPVQMGTVLSSRQVQPVQMETV